jgi:hypothetical protein
LHRSKDLGVQGKSIGALTEETDFIFEREHQQLVLPKKLPQTTVFGEKLQGLARGAVGSSAEITQLESFDPSESQEAEIEERLVSDHPHIVGKAPDAVENFPTPSPLLLDRAVRPGTTTRSGRTA